jgi:cytochrome c556
MSHMTSLRIHLIALCLLAGSAAAADDPIDAIKKGQPKDVVRFIDRYVECVHWGGEEPYDAERRKEILAAVTRLRCSKLDADEKAIRKKYTNKPRVLNAIDRAKALYY